MNRFFVLILVAVWSVFAVDAQTTFSKNLKAGKKQTVVFYGTSAAINPSNRFWVEQLQGKLDKQFPGKVDFYNCSKSGIGSFWATENLQRPAANTFTEVMPEKILMRVSVWKRVMDGYSRVR